MSTLPRGVWVAYAAIAALLGLQAFPPEPEAVSAPPVPAPSAIAADFVGTAAIELTRVSAGEAHAVVLRPQPLTEGSLCRGAGDRPGSPWETSSPVHPQKD